MKHLGWDGLSSMDVSWAPHAVAAALVKAGTEPTRAHRRLSIGLRRLDFDAFVSALALLAKQSEQGLGEVVTAVTQTVGTGPLIVVPCLANQGLVPTALLLVLMLSFVHATSVSADSGAPNSCKSWQARS